MKGRLRFALGLLLLMMVGPVTFLSSNEQDRSPPEGLFIALQIAQEWWELRSKGFPDFVWSKPSPNWRFFPGELDSSTITYFSPSLDNKTQWLATYKEPHPDFWKIYIPTLNNWTIRIDIILNENREKKGDIIEVRFIYAFLDLHGVYL